MSDPYKDGKFKDNPYHDKSYVEGQLVVVLSGRLDNRGLDLITPISRCVCKHEIHELIFTDEQAGPGEKVERIAYLGFFEVQTGGVLLAGDQLELDGELMGTVAGFDQTHMPNHLNIVINTKRLNSGKDLGLGLGKKIKFKLSSRR